MYLTYIPTAAPTSDQRVPFGSHRGIVIRLKKLLFALQVASLIGNGLMFFFSMRSIVAVSSSLKFPAIATASQLIGVFPAICAAALLDAMSSTAETEASIFFTQSRPHAVALSWMSALFSIAAYAYWWIVWCIAFGGLDVKRRSWHVGKNQDLWECVDDASLDTKSEIISD